jgi:hypothetical protein
MTAKEQKSRKKKARETESGFPCADFERMADMISNC